MGNRVKGLKYGNTSANALQLLATRFGLKFCMLTLFSSLEFKLSSELSDISIKGLESA